MRRRRWLQARRLLFGGWFKALKTLFLSLGKDYMFDRNFIKQRQKELQDRLDAAKAKIDEQSYLRPWKETAVEPDLVAGLGAFREDSVSADDFYEAAEECLEAVFYLKEEADGS